MKRAKKKTAKKQPNSALEDFNNIELPDDLDLNDDFLTAFDTIENTKKNLYITGEAGTGKTTLLKYFKSQSKRNFVVLAPTGIAAINSGGQTIHSFFNFPHKLIQHEDIKKVFNSKKIFQNLDLLIVDEASMMRADLMDGIDYALRLNKGIMDIPFAGVQIVLFGDLAQLPPIVDREMAPIYNQLYSTPYFFSANSFGAVPFHHFTLTTNYRQRDKKFTNILNRIRDKSITQEEMGLLNARVTNIGSVHTGDTITLTPTNRAAGSINDERLDQLSAKEFSYSAEIYGEYDRSAYPTETELYLREGAQVLMIKNDP